MTIYSEYKLGIPKITDHTTLSLSWTILAYTITYYDYIRNSSTFAKVASSEHAKNLKMEL